MAWGRFKGKYGNKKVETDGYSFASQLEAAVYTIVKSNPLWEFVRTQARVLLTDAQIEYRPDFEVIELSSGKTIYVEAKGFETPEWRIKRRLWISYGPGDLYVYKGSARNPRLFEVLAGVLKDEPKPRNQLDEGAGSSVSAGSDNELNQTSCRCKSSPCKVGAKRARKRRTNQEVPDTHADTTKEDQQ